MQMMFAINASNFEGLQEVTCNSCHRGAPKPLAIPVIAESAPHLLNEAAPAAQAVSADVPKVDVVVAKHIAAVGGSDAISKLTSIAEKGTFQAGPRQFPVEVLKKSPDHVATITHWPSADSVTAFDGKSGWIAFPGRPLRPMSTSDMDASRMDADLHFAIDLTKTFAELRVEKVAKLENRDTVIVSGQRPNQPLVEMYFDAQTGLLLRLVRYTQSPLGRNPTQVDYSDYREVAGVKIPCLWTSAMPTGRFTIQIESAQPNSSIPESRFEKPAVLASPGPSDT